MIRPLTCLAFLLACGSGLYVYQAKHRVKMLDEQITQTIRSTDALREQTRMLSAEWTLLNDPERLRQLANQFLTLQTVSPNQFTSLGDLDSRLPAPVAPGPPPGAAEPRRTKASRPMPGRPTSSW
jgi:cell division protein FtsL